MPESLTIHPYFIAIPAALLPGILGWWWSRTLPADATVLPEWQMAISRKLSFAVAPCTMAIVALTGWSSLWLVPLLLLGLSYSGHRVRRALRGETWSLLHYLVWMVRGFVGIFGFSTFLAIAPALVTHVGPGAVWWVAGACTVVAIAWLHFSFRVLLWTLNATPLQRPDLDEPFQRVFDRASASRPTVWRAGARGAVMANALALPSLDMGRVLFFDTLLERLTGEEITAILAHEVAHLEHHNRSRLLRSYVSAYVLILIMVPGAALLTTMGLGQSWLAAVAPPAIVMLALWARASRMQAHETESDLRAVELCGNPEALVSALTRIYAINHIPRRVSVVSEQRATHPSLARRIRDIREHARVGPAPRLAERVVLSSSETGRFAILDSDHVSFGWMDEAIQASPDDDLARRASRLETISYKELAELRLITTTTSVALTAVDHHARQWTLPLQPADAPIAQAALDVVDQFLGHVPVKNARDWQYRITAVVTLMFCWTASVVLSLVMPALLALARPTRRTMIGMSAALAGAGLLSLSGVPQDRVLAIILFVLAVVAAWQIRRPSDEQSKGGRWIWIEHGAFVLPILAGIGLTALNGFHVFRIHTTLRDQPWFAVSLLAFTGYLAASPRRSSRGLAAVAGVFASLAAWAGSPSFPVQVAADPLVVEMPLLQEREVPLTRMSQNVVEGEFLAVSLAPDGRHFLLSGEADEEYEDEGEIHPRRFVVGDFDGWSRELQALDATFVLGDQLLLLGHTRGDSEIRAETVRDGDPRWSLTIPDFTADSISAADNGRWRAVGRRRKRLSRFEGMVGSADSTRTDWTIDVADDEYPADHRVDDGDVGIAMSYRWTEPLLPWMDSNWRPDTSILRLDADRTTSVAKTRLMLNCPEPPVGATGFVCVAYDGRLSRVWRFDDRASRLTPVGQTRGLVWASSQSRKDLLTGAVNGRQMLLNLHSGTIDFLKTDGDECVPGDHARAGNLVATVCADEGETVVRLYRLGEPTATTAD